MTDIKESLRLRYIEVVDFRRSEATNFGEFSQKNRALVQTFRPSDVVLFINAGLDQLVFVYGFVTIAAVGRVAVEREILASRRLRLKNGRWSPQMLVNYAEKVGLKLAGLRTFQEIMADRSKKGAEASD